MRPDTIDAASDLKNSSDKRPLHRIDRNAVSATHCDDG
jgi:hypothetical protein